MNDVNPQVGKHRNVLSMADNFKLANWLKKRPDASTAHEEELAKAASAELGGLFTEANIRSVRVASGIVKNAQRRPSRSTDIIVSAVVGLYNQLGIEVPADLATLKKKDRQ